MKIRVVAIANIGTFIAGDSDENYCVVTLDDTKDIDLGDTLSGTFDGRGSLFSRVDNLTKDTHHNYIANLNGDMYIQSVIAGSKRFDSSSQDVAGQIVREIARARSQEADS